MPLPTPAVVESRAVVPAAESPRRELAVREAELRGEQVHPVREGVEDVLTADRSSIPIAFSTKTMGATMAAKPSTRTPSRRWYSFSSRKANLPSRMQMEPASASAPAAKLFRTTSPQAAPTSCPSAPATRRSEVRMLTGITLPSPRRAKHRKRCCALLKLTTLYRSLSQTRCAGPTLLIRPTGTC